MLKCPQTYNLVRFKSLKVTSHLAITLVLACGLSASGQDLPPTLPQTVVQTAPLQTAPLQSSSTVTQAASQERIAAKPAIRESVSGATFVALDPKLKTVFRGHEPRTLDELKALEKQQARVAASIEAVTVNVQQGSAQGSGVIIRSDGYVLTAAHVAGKPGRDAWVVFSDGTRVAAKTMGMDRDRDAGLIKITDSDRVWPHASIGKSSELEIGQWVIAAGHPGGWQVNRGSVIRVGRVLAIRVNRNATDEKRKKPHTLFTDCTLIGGDSGGPLFDLEGKLVGIHSRIGTELEDNMHVPIDVFLEDWKRLTKGEAWGVLPGYRPIIGVKGVPDSNNTIVQEVYKNSPASAAGIAEGDEIVSFDGNETKTFDELISAVQQCLPGDRVEVVVKRAGQRLKMALTVGLEE